MDLPGETDNPRIANLTRLMSDLGKTRSPFETLKTLRRGLADVYGPTTILMLSTQGLPAGKYRVIELRLDTDPTFDGPDPWAHGQFPVHEGGLIARIITDPRPQLIDDACWSGDPTFHETLAEYRSIMAIPFPGKSVPIDWAILMAKGPAQFTEKEFEESVLRVTLIGSLLESQTLAGDLARANERIESDVREVADLQRALLPEPLPTIPGLEIATSYHPSGRAGGDWFDFFPIDDSPAGRWCLFIGDASGHGSAAAVVMAIVQSILRVPPDVVGGPADLLAHANRHLCRKRIPGFVTAFLGIWEPATRRLTYASAGHPPPLVKSAGAARELRTFDTVGSYPIGIDEADSFEEAAVRFEPGDTLLMYTDGITEARDPAGNMLDAARLDAAFRAGKGGPAQLIEHLRNAVQEFQRGDQPLDDQTMVVIRS